jgi:predicted Zn-dependent protease
MRYLFLSGTLFLVPFLSGLGGCATNPVSGGSDFVLMSEEQEIALGRKYSSEITKDMPLYENAELSTLVQDVGERVAANSHRPELIYRFAVLDSTDVNAFALPGGYIYITRGLLAYLNTEAELAAVLGHEIGHVTARHSVRQHSTATAAGLVAAVLGAASGIQGADSLANMVGTAIVRGYGRDHELEADRLGAEYLARTGYDPDAMLEIVSILKHQEEFEKSRSEREDREPVTYHGLFSTHPENDERLQEVVKAARAHKSSLTTRVNRSGFIQALDDLTFGDSEREGIIRDNRFYHKELDFAVTFPQGWRIENRADKVIAMPASNDGLVQLSITDRNKRISPQEFMITRLKLENLKQGEPVSSHGLTGYTAVASSKTPYGTRPVRYVVLYRGQKAYIFAGAAKDKNSPYGYDREILATAHSFHALAEEEKILASEEKIRIIRASTGARYRDLANSSPIANYPEEQLRLLNGHYPDAEPRPGQLIKIVH